MESIVKTKQLEKVYGENETEVIALNKIDIEFKSYKKFKINDIRTYIYIYI